jgi:alkylhydroperoxidase family enzyme
VDRAHGACVEQLGLLEALAARDLGPERLPAVEARLRLLLGAPGSPVSETAPVRELPPAVAAFVEQFVIDVAGTTDEVTGPLREALGPSAGTFVPALYVLEQTARYRMAAARLLGEGAVVHRLEPAPVPPGAALWPAIEAFLRAVGRLDALDPVTTEVVRLKGAAIHDCRLCRSRRSLAALDRAGDGALFDDVARGRPSDPADTRLAAALAVAEAVLTRPTDLDGETVQAARLSFTEDEVVELLLDLVRNAANKIAVALGADDAKVDGGVEYYDLDPGGDVVADVDPAVVRAATGR